MKVQMFLRHSTRFVWGALLRGIDNGRIFSWLSMVGPDDQQRMRVTGPSILKTASPGVLWVTVDSGDEFPRGFDIHVDFGFVSWDIVIMLSMADQQNTTMDVSIYEFIPTDRMKVGQRMLLRVLRRYIHEVPKDLRRYLDRVAWTP